MPIQYVFVLMQENRSFDSYYGRFQDYLKDVLKLTDVRTKKYVDQSSPDGVDVPGTPYELRKPCDQYLQQLKLDDSYDPRVDAPFNPTKPGKPPEKAKDKHYWHHAKNDNQQCVSDTCHEWWCSHMAWNSGRMDGFYAANKNYYEGGEPIAESADVLAGDRALLYYDQTNIPFYYWLAEQFALGDHYFASLLGPTWPNRDYLYGATSRGLVANGSEKYGGSFFVNGQTAGSVTASPPVKNGNNTIYDAMDNGGVSYYQWVRNRYSDITAARFGAWYGGKGFITNRTRTYDESVNTGESGFEVSVQNENQNLINGNTNLAGIASVNFIDADPQEDVNGEDEHPPATPQMGQQLSYDVVRVLMSNPEVWKRSVLFITYDEGGGFYDHVAPPSACSPDDIDPNFAGGAYGTGANGDSTDQEYGGTFNRYGFRVPLIVVSPWAKRHSVSHVTYDHTSVDRFIEARFGLPALTDRDANADPLVDLFDFSKIGSNMASPTFGTDTLPTEFVSTPSDDLEHPTTTAVGSIAHYGGMDPLLGKANGTCASTYPAAANESPVTGSLGAEVYGPYVWSSGKAPPPGYSAAASHPFPGSGSSPPPKVLLSPAESKLSCGDSESLQVKFDPPPTSTDTDFKFKYTNTASVGHLTALRAMTKDNFVTIDASATYNVNDGDPTGTDTITVQAGCETTDEKGNKTGHILGDPASATIKVGSACDSSFGYIGSTNYNSGCVMELSSPSTVHPGDKVTISAQSSCGGVVLSLSGAVSAEINGVSAPGATGDSGTGVYDFCYFGEPQPAPSGGFAVTLPDNNAYDVTFTIDPTLKCSQCVREITTGLPECYDNTSNHTYVSGPMVVMNGSGGTHGWSAVRFFEIQVP